MSMEADWSTGLTSPPSSQHGGLAGSSASSKAERSEA
jgi:hypothetical protein